MIRQDCFDLEKGIVDDESSLNGNDIAGERKVGTVFNPEEHRPFTTPGAASVTGHAFFHRPDKTFLLCCHVPVLTFPDTPYTREIVAVIRAGKSPGLSPFKTKGAPRIDFHTSCDHHGNFRFYDLHAYRYFFAASVQWMERGEHQTGTLLSLRTLRPGENVVVLSNVLSR